MRRRFAPPSRSTGRPAPARSPRRPLNLDPGQTGSTGDGLRSGFHLGSGALIDIAVLVSGRGTNLQALLDRQGDYRVASVVADRDGIGALDRARAAGVPVDVVEWSGDRMDFTREVCDAIERHSCRLMVMAGFNRILGPEAMTRFPNRILNIHPSLLPAFPGTLQQALDGALAHGVKLTGVTVHLVDEQTDHGPIVAQVAVPVLPGDTTASLHARLQVEEHSLYPQVVAAFARGEISVEDRLVTWKGGA